MKASEQPEQKTPSPKNHVHTNESAQTPNKRRRPQDFTPETSRKALAKQWADRKARADSLNSATFLGHLPAIQSPASTLLPRILANEVEFRSSILDRIRFMEGRLVEALDQRLYNVDLASLPTLIREWRNCLELSLRIVEKTKGLDTEDAKVNQVSGLLAREALLRHELGKLGVLDASGRIVRGPETEQEAPGGTISGGPMSEYPMAPDRLPGGTAEALPQGSGEEPNPPKPRRRRGRPSKRAPRKRGGMTTGSLSGGCTGDSKPPSGPPSSPPPRSQEVLDGVGKEASR